jgi:hypothetical protein
VPEQRLRRKIGSIVRARTEDPKLSRPVATLHCVSNHGTSRGLSILARDKQNRNAITVRIDLGVERQGYRLSLTHVADRSDGAT